MTTQKNTIIHTDAVVVGAGFAGLYMLHTLRDKLGLKAEVFETADDVGGTWYWNRYPGARCDIASYHYSFSFSEEVQQEWTWSEKYAGQAEILDYLRFVANKLDLKDDITFETRVISSDFDERTNRWTIKTDRGHTVICKYYISGVGTLSTAAIPNYPGKDSFKGEVYATSRWPHEGVNFTGKTVGIIGTGASAIQAIPLIAEQARHLTVFQRTPNYATPLQNGPMEEAEANAIKANYGPLRNEARAALAGGPFPNMRESIFNDTPEQVQQHLEDCWNDGGFALWLGSYGDVLFDEKANAIVAEFVRNKIRARVNDPKTAELLCPDYLYGTKRQPCETNYFETYNRDNVSLVDIKSNSIRRINEQGLELGNEDGYKFDCLIYSTGFDAFTGPLFKLNLKGRNGLRLQDYWNEGPRTNLGLMSNGFPNFFMITGPQSPSVLFNMPLGIEQHVEWIANTIQHMEAHGIDTIEPEKAIEDEWREVVEGIANSTLLPKTNTWYTGSNIPGKPRSFMVYLGGGAAYKQVCDEVAQSGYAGFVLSKATASQEAVAS
ncbi:NAD(P)/FAD-dependent oxidoreductase [Marinobacter sp.]|uniref:flavin-containing monooxygenase n=1 Tax=Marinobacter sp. TaxID=50741 RepID=UPI002B27277E|nr:NAD(P)/FAD-dependent oxidoreductase [Marinobacter sp.]